MGRIYRTYLSGTRIWTCSHCKAHLAYHEDIISKAFQGRHGKAYLFSNVVNIGVGKPEERQLITGLHVVADIHCNCCSAIIGWKYEEAFEETQKYKVGKFIVEKAMMTRDDGCD